MSRGSAKAAMGQVGQDKAMAKQYNASGQDVLGTLAPALKGDVNNPQGFNPADLAAMNTASGQSLGGSTAGAVGDLLLHGARNRNAGNYGAAMDESARSGQRQNSENALNTQMANAMLKEKHRSAGLQGLEDLYGTNTHATLGALGLTNDAINAWTQGRKAVTDNTLGWANWYAQMVGNSAKAAAAGGG